MCVREEVERKERWKERNGKSRARPDKSRRQTCQHESKVGETSYYNDIQFNSDNITKQKSIQSDKAVAVAVAVGPVVAGVGVVIGIVVVSQWR